MKTRPDILAVVEAAYQVDVPAEIWLQRMAEVVRPHLDEGFGLAAFEFRRTADGLPTMEHCCRIGVPDQLDAIYARTFEGMDPEIARRPFRMGPCVTGSQLMGMRREFRDHPYMKQHAQRFGMYDSIWITATDPGGRGCGFHAGRPKVGWASRAESQRWGQVAAHLAAAVRLRHRLDSLRAQHAQHAQPPPDAVLDPSGKIHDAPAGADARALESLRKAVLLVERARGAMRAEDPEGSLAGWKGLVSGRWSLLDQMDHAGRRYIVARQNEPTARGPTALTMREKQVLGYAQLGHHNKLIAYDLGIADSTVRVLMARAAAKLGVRTRDQLLRAHAVEPSDGGLSGA